MSIAILRTFVSAAPNLIHHSPPSLRSLLLLLLAVVVGFAYGLQVLDIPEQLLVTVMRLDVVNHRTIRSMVCSQADQTCLPAGVVVALKDFLPQLLPSTGPVPLAMFEVLITLTISDRFSFLPVGRRYRREARPERLQSRLQRFQLAHIPRCNKGDR